MKNIVVIGGGVGGLTAAAVLSRAHFNVTVLEAHVYAGGSAGTFFHQGYKFDAGATLAGGFYPGGPMDQVARAAGISRWPARPTSEAMAVHLSDGRSVTRWGDERRHETRREAFGENTAGFWEWQEAAADALWDFALRSPSWPPQSARQAVELAKIVFQWLAADPRGRLNPGLALDLLRPAAARLKKASPALREFIDGQLLISAQAPSAAANALYAAAALDLPRRGVVHLEGGMGSLADTLVKAVRANGGKVLFRRAAESVQMRDGRITAVVDRFGKAHPADLVLANLTPWGLARLMGSAAPRRIRNLPPRPKDGWGAFMVYAGVDTAVFPKEGALHHQVIAARPLGEGNSVFISASPEWDAGRAPVGQRAVTLSTHTRMDAWWDLFENDRDRYESRKKEYVAKMLAHAERALPGFSDGASFVMSGTPVTFERFTRRPFGWVGGFPQTNLFRAWGPRLGPNLWMVGDSIFPGQSTAAVALGGMRIANEILAEKAVETSEVSSGFPAVPSKPQLKGRES